MVLVMLPSPAPWPALPPRLSFAGLGSNKRAKSVAYQYL
jgi:hypothetical protein